jgi:hypothetical protein
LSAARRRAPPGAHAARQRRYRRRQAASRVVVTIEILPEETAKLARLYYLRDSQLEDRKAIAVALHMILANIE